MMFFYFEFVNFPVFVSERLRPLRVWEAFRLISLTAAIKLQLCAVGFKRPGRVKYQAGDFMVSNDSRSPLKLSSANGSLGRGESSARRSNSLVSAPKRKDPH